MKGRDSQMNLKPAVPAVLPLLILVLALTACRGTADPAPGGPEPPAPVAEHPLRPHFVTALEELRQMNDQGRAGDFTQAEVHFRAFRAAYDQVSAAIGEQDAKLKIHIDQGIAELVFEFQKEQPRAFELDEENMKLSQLLEKGGGLLGVQVPPELVLRRTVEAIPFKHERRVEVTLSEYTVKPALIEVEVDTRLTLVITNAGDKVHELAVDHYGFEVEDIQPGQTAELTFVTLDKGRFDLACFLPGHYEAGMRAELVVR